MAESQDLVRTTPEMRQTIICPLCFAIALKSEDRLGAIQSYRCAPRPNSGGWETRPQPKTDKWTADFYKVLHAPKGELVTLSDGETQMKGLGKSEEVKSLHFPHYEGVEAKRRAIQAVKSGLLRAPRNWDKIFAQEAGVTKDQLERTYPEKYKSTAGSRTKREVPDEIAEPLGLFEDEEPVSMTVQEYQVSNQEKSLSDEEEEEFEEEEYEEEDQPSYSVLADVLEEESAVSPEEVTNSYQKVVKTENKFIINLKKPYGGHMGSTLHRGARGFRADIGGEYVTFYKVEDPERPGKYMFLQEGANEDFSGYILNIEE